MKQLTGAGGSGIVKISYVKKAFPNNRSEGMDLRDYFASTALQGFIMAGAEVEEAVIEAYLAADMMMKARGE